MDSVPRPHRFVYFLQNDSADATFWIMESRVGPITPKFELRLDFCTWHLAVNFHHPMFNYSEVIVLTYKQTHPQTNKRTPLKTPTMVCRWV